MVTDGNRFCQQKPHPVQIAVCSMNGSCHIESAGMLLQILILTTLGILYSGSLASPEMPYLNSTVHGIISARQRTGLNIVIQICCCVDSIHRIPILVDIRSLSVPIVLLSPTQSGMPNFLPFCKLSFPPPPILKFFHPSLLLLFCKLPRITFRQFQFLRNSERASCAAIQIHNRWPYLIFVASFFPI